jgi:hypothetical protein
MTTKRTTQYDAHCFVWWGADDVKVLRPEWPPERCLAELRTLERRMQDEMLRKGWEVLETLLPKDSNG